MLCGIACQAEMQEDCDHTCQAHWADPWGMRDCQARINAVDLLFSWWPPLRQAQQQPGLTATRSCCFPIFTPQPSILLHPAAHLVGTNAQIVWPAFIQGGVKNAAIRSHCHIMGNNLNAEAIYCDVLDDHGHILMVFED